MNALGKSEIACTMPGCRSGLFNPHAQNFCPQCNTLVSDMPEPVTPRTVAMRLAKIPDDYLPCECCERRDDEGKFKRHEEHCPKGAGIEARKLFGLKPKRWRA